MHDKINWSIAFLLSLLLSPLLPGIINKVKAFFAGRKGPSIWQLYFDLAKLIKKESIISTTSGGVIKFAPIVTLVMILGASLFMPFGGINSPFAFTGDIIFFFYLLGTSRIAMVLGALDTGSSFEGMGASREMQFSALAEPVILVIAAFLAVLTKRSDLSMFATAVETAGGHTVSLWLAALAVFLILLMENCHVPADDPDTHLELTMIHEAMILDCAGPDLALMLYSSAVKLWLFASFLVLLVMPKIPASPLLNSLIYLGGVALVTIIVGIIESSMARYRFLKVPQMLFGAFGAALLGLAFLIFFEGGLY